MSVIIGVGIGLIFGPQIKKMFGGITSKFGGVGLADIDFKYPPIGTANTYDYPAIDFSNAYAGQAMAPTPGVRILTPSRRFDRDYHSYEQGYSNSLPALW